MPRCPTINIQLSKISKWLAKHISTKVSFKITIRKTHVYIVIGRPWIRIQCFYLGIWNDDRTKMMVLASFHFAARLNSQNTNETEFSMKSDTLISLWIFVFPIGIIEVSTQVNVFLTLFLFLTQLLTSKHQKLYSIYLVGLNGTMWKTCFSASQNAKKISLNIKTKCVTDFLLTVRNSSMKDYTCHYVEST